MENNLEINQVTKSGFKLLKKIDSLDEFWQVINSDISMFARNRMYPTAFFYSWQIKLIKEWIDKGWFFRAVKKRIKIKINQ